MMNNESEYLIEKLFNIVNSFINVYNNEQFIMDICKLDRLMHIVVGDMANRLKGSEVLKKLGLDRNMWEYRVLTSAIELRGDIVHLKGIRIKSKDQIFAIDNQEVILKALMRWAKNLCTELTFITSKDGSKIVEIYGLTFVVHNGNSTLLYSSNGNSIIIKEAK